MRDPDFLGTLSLSGSSDLENAIDSATAVDQPILNGLMAFIVFGVQTLYPEFDPRDVLDEDALAVYTAAVEKGCSAASGAFTSVPTARMFKPGWKGNPYVKRLLERDRPGARPIYGPVFLVGGGSDVMFTESAGTRVFQRLCASGAMVRRSVYPGLGHDAVVYGSLKDQVAWIASRFAGDPAPSDCAVPTTSSWLSEALADNPWGF